MDIRWQGEIYVSAPYDLLYSYLADFPRHADWSQTIERVEQVKPGDAAGSGAQFHVFERQGMQSNRMPYQPLTTGQPIESLLDVRELSPSYRIAWGAETLRKPRMLGEYSFDLTGDGAYATRLLQRITLHTTKPYDMLDKLRNRTDPVILRGQLRAQWEAGLRNIKEVVEMMAREQRVLIPTHDERSEPVARERHA
jgi:hypothetical protein